MYEIIDAVLTYIMCAGFLAFGIFALLSGIDSRPKDKLSIFFGLTATLLAVTTAVFQGIALAT